MTRKTRIIISLVLVLVAFAAGIAVFADQQDHRDHQDNGGKVGGGEQGEFNLRARAEEIGEKLFHILSLQIFTVY